MNKLEKAFVRLRSNTYRFFSKVFGWRPSSHPYISGDSFRKLARLRWDEWKPCPFRPEDIKENDIVFISIWHWPVFYKEFLPVIKNRFFLIASNGDQNLAQQYIPVLPKTVLSFWSINMLVHMERVKAIPLGLENYWYKWHGDIQAYKALGNLRKEKIFKILYGFTVDNGRAIREPLLEILNQLEIAEQSPRLNSYEYRRHLRKYAFVCSPSGNGEECHRTWEAMYLGVVPIVTRCAAMEHFESLGMPIKLIDTWDEVKLWDEETLRKIFQELSPRFDSQALKMDFWEKQIRETIGELIS